MSKGRKSLRCRIGEKYISNEGLEFEIIEYYTAHNITVKFSNGYIVYNAQYSNIKLGRITNPLHPSVFGVGFEGIGKYSWTTHPKVYYRWSKILERCYDEKCQEKHPTYKNCKVHPKWLNFQNFAKWHEDNWSPLREGRWELDKDILVKGNKIYSEATCCFVPQEINRLFTKANSIRGKYPIGVSKQGNRFRAECQVEGKSLFLGYHDSPEIAYQIYKITKEKEIKRLANKYKEQITKFCYEALMNYKVEEND